MQVGGVIFYWHAVLMNIIHCLSAPIQHLPEKRCKVAQIYTQDRTYDYIRVEKYEQILHYSTAFYILAVSITCYFDRLFPL